MKTEPRTEKTDVVRVATSIASSCPWESRDTVPLTGARPALRVLLCAMTMDGVVRRRQEPDILSEQVEHAASRAPRQARGRRGGWRLEKE